MSTFTAIIGHFSPQITTDQEFTWSEMDQKWRDSALYLATSDGPAYLDEQNTAQPTSDGQEMDPVAVAFQIFPDFHTDREAWIETATLHAKLNGWILGAFHDSERPYFDVTPDEDFWGDELPTTK